VHEWLDLVVTLAEYYRDGEWLKEAGKDILFSLSTTSFPDFTPGWILKCQQFFVPVCIAVGYQPTFGKLKWVHARAKSHPQRMVQITSVQAVYVPARWLDLISSRDDLFAQLGMLLQYFLKNRRAWNLSQRGILWIPTSRILSAGLFWARSIYGFVRRRVKRFFSAFPKELAGYIAILGMGKLSEEDSKSGAQSIDVCSVFLSQPFFVAWATFNRL